MFNTSAPKKFLCRVPRVVGRKSHVTMYATASAHGPEPALGVRMPPRHWMQVDEWICVLFLFPLGSEGMVRGW